jgi:hypothetical protein
LRILAFAALLPACTAVLGAESTQCSVDGDCRARGFAQAVCTNRVCRPADEARWTCVERDPVPRVAEGETVEVTMELYDPVRPTVGLARVGVRACARLDVTCATPLAGPVDTDAAGHATLTVPGSFDGYLELKSTSAVPAIWFFSPRPIRATTYRVPLLSAAGFGDVAKNSGATIDPARGHVFLFALDCDLTFGTFAPGVSFSVEPAEATTRSFYLAGGLPSTTATQTDESGIGGFVNLAPGVVTVRGSIVATKRPSGTASVLVRPGTVTYSAIAPQR